MYSKFILTGVLAVTIMACSKKNDQPENSPARQIMESEALTIPAAVDLPANLPGGNTRVVTYFADGVQRYKAQLKDGSSPATYEWVLAGPQANLYDITNKKIGTHSTGPTWQLRGSTTDSIYAQQFAPPKSAPAPDAGSIDWLLLMPKDGKTPTGIFANVSYIQRIDTKGGKAPATPPASETETTAVPYTAIYRFTMKNP